MQIPTGDLPYSASSSYRSSSAKQHQPSLGLTNCQWLGPVLARPEGAIRKAGKAVRHANEGISDATRLFLNGGSLISFVVAGPVHSLTGHSRNCTKHQVRCDYMETVGSDTEGQSSPDRPSLVLTPGTESRIEVWQQTGSFPYPELQVFPPPQTHEYSKNELRLISHVSSISNDLLLKGTSHLTVWTQMMPK